jgi:hypothetical protein
MWEVVVFRVLTLILGAIFYGAYTRWEVVVFRFLTLIHAAIFDGPKRSWVEIFFFTLGCNDKMLNYETYLLSIKIRQFLIFEYVYEAGARVA